MEIKYIMVVSVHGAADQVRVMMGLVVVVVVAL